MGFRHSSELARATFETVSEYNLKGLRTQCKMLRVYDGDTCWIAARVHGRLYKYKVRMLGYDTPEMKPLKSNPHREEEKKKATEARDYLHSLVFGKDLEIEFFGYCKYGRPLAVLYAKHVSTPAWCCKSKSTFMNVNDAMLQSGHAVPYFGGKKGPFVPAEIVE